MRKFALLPRAHDNMHIYVAIVRKARRKLIKFGMAKVPWGFAVQKARTDWMAVALSKLVPQVATMFEYSLRFTKPAASPVYAVRGVPGDTCAALRGTRSARNSIDCPRDASYRQQQGLHLPVKWKEQLDDHEQGLSRSPPTAGECRSCSRNSLLSSQAAVMMAALVVSFAVAFGVSAALFQLSDRSAFH